MVTPGAKREAVAHAREQHGLSERGACSLVGVSRRVIRYEPMRPDDGALRQRLRELAAERRRFGYRRLGYLLAREGMKPNHKKLLRIYREEGLRVRRRGGRKRALGTRRPTVLPDGPNQRWSLDFVSDSLICGRRFRILCVVDDFSRECLALVADTSLSGARVARGGGAAAGAAAGAGEAGLAPAHHRALDRRPAALLGGHGAPAIREQRSTLAPALLQATPAPAPEQLRLPAAGWRGWRDCHTFDSNSCSSSTCGRAGLACGADTLDSAPARPRARIGSPSHACYCSTMFAPI